MFHLHLCSADNVKFSPDGSVITITDARPVNHGAYRCVASNPFGITHTVVSLTVKGKHPNILVSIPLKTQPASGLPHWTQTRTLLAEALGTHWSCRVQFGY